MQTHQECLAIMPPFKILYPHHPRGCHHSGLPPLRIEQWQKPDFEILGRIRGINENSNCKMLVGIVFIAGLKLQLLCAIKQGNVIPFQIKADCQREQRQLLHLEECAPAFVIHTKALRGVKVLLCSCSTRQGSQEKNVQALRILTFFLLSPNRVSTPTPLAIFSHSISRSSSETQMSYLEGK